MINETIFAPATAAGKAGVTVIRVSGSRAGEVLMACTQKPLPPPREAQYGAFFELNTREIIDKGLALWFPGPKSFTGEDVVEFHIHGGRATTEAICNTINQIEHCRFADPGEFTRRAFYNEKLDLTEVEGLADLVAAETEGQRKQAFRQFNGDLSALYDKWRSQLIRTMALLEASIDFSEEDLPEDLLLRVKHNILCLKKEITQYIDDSRHGERLRDGFFIVIIGAPNVGKSSLLNALAQRDVAIVSEFAGTTRDAIEVRMDVGGLPITIADTAGLRDVLDEIEAEGVKRARKRAKEADLRLLMFDATQSKPDKATMEMMDQNAIVVVNKIDLLKKNATMPIKITPKTVLISALTGQNLKEVLDIVSEKIQNLSANSDLPPITRARHRYALKDCVRGLKRAWDAKEPELIAEDIRLAAGYLGRITGKVDVEDFLDVIFSEFCIGK